MRIAAPSLPSLPSRFTQLQQLRRVLAQHALVHHEAARAKDHAAARVHIARLAFDARLEAHDPRLFGRPVDDEAFAERGRLGAHAGIDGGGAERPHQHQPAALAGVLRVVASRRGLRKRAERVGEFAARVGQAVLGAPGVGAALRGQELGLERHAAGDEPIVELDAAVAIRAQPLVVRAGLHRGAQVPVHVLGRVVEAARALQRRAPAEVDRAAGERAGAAAGELALQHQHVRAGLGRLDRRGGSRRAEAHDDHVRLEVPGGHLGRCERSDRGRLVGAHRGDMLRRAVVGRRRRVAVASRGRLHCARAAPRPAADAACRCARSGRRQRDG